MYVIADKPNSGAVILGLHVKIKNDRIKDIKHKIFI